MGNYLDLKVWQKSKELAARIYRLTNNGAFKKDFRFRDQIRAAAISVPSNIAEGDELGTNKQSIRHFYIAKGSVAEVVTQLMIAEDICYVDSDLIAPIKEDYQHISHMLAKLIKARS